MTNDSKDRAKVEFQDETDLQLLTVEELAEHVLGFRANIELYIEEIGRRIRTQAD
jgi:hypothetical protein